MFTASSLGAGSWQRRRRRRRRWRQQSCLQLRDLTACIVPMNTQPRQRPRTIPTVRNTAIRALVTRPRPRVFCSALISNGFAMVINSELWRRVGVQVCDQSPIGLASALKILKLMQLSHSRMGA